MYSGYDLTLAFRRIGESAMGPELKPAPEHTSQARLAGTDM